MEAASGGGDRSDIHTFLAGAAAFLQMGSNYMRIVAAISVLVHRHMEPPVALPPPEGAHQLSSEIADYALKNFKTFYDAFTDGPWSSDSDTEADVQAKAKAILLVAKSWDEMQATKGRNVEPQGNKTMSF